MLYLSEWIKIRIKFWAEIRPVTGINGDTYKYDMDMNADDSKNTENAKHVKTAALKAAFPHTIPILTGFLFLGFAHGLLMKVSGFNFLYSILTAAIVFGGSLEFVLVSMLLAPFAPLQTFLMAVMIQARHLFYGIAMLDKYNIPGFKRIYMIYAMCDESFSINCTVDVPDGIDKGWFMFFVSLLDQLYWITGSALGGIFGSFVSFNTEGLDFVMTAMFTVIFLERLLKEKNHSASAIGMAASVICLMIFGADSFLIPTMVCIILLLTFFRKPLEAAGGFAQ